MFQKSIAAIPICWVLWFLGTPATAAESMTVTSSEESGGTAQQQAEKLVLGELVNDYGVLEETCNFTYVAGSANTIVNAAGNPLSSSKSMGWFKNGNVVSGTLFQPDENQPNPKNPTVTYAGGIGIEIGICFCTGLVSDNDPIGSAGIGRGIGIQGPNNGQGDIAPNAGEIGYVFFINPDHDFLDLVIDEDGGDPSVLVFQVQVNKTGYIQASFAFGSDEFPFFITQEFNDSFGVFVKQQGGDYENIVLFREPGQAPEPFTLQDVRECGEPLFKKNQVAPVPDVLLTSGHQIPVEPVEQNIREPADPNVPNFDHEFGGFTKLFSRETAKPLAAGTYTIKIVIQDVADVTVDAGLFLPKDGIKLFTVLEADFDMDGDVDGDDFLVWQSNFPTANGATKASGDADLDGDVDGDDFLSWQGESGDSGNPDARADFDRDGDVDGDDFLIWQANLGLSQCASRFEGDADNDGDVDGDDFLIWQNEFGAISQDPGCGEGGGGASAASSGGGGSSSAKTNEDAARTFSADFNDDGSVNAADVAAIRAVQGFNSAATRVDDDVNNDGVFDASDLRAWRDGSARSSETSLAGLAIDAAVAYYTQIFGGSSE